MYDLTTPEGVVAYMGESTSRSDWSKRCDEVKAANDGNYPIFWYATVILSGLIDKILGAGASDLKVITL